MTRKNRVLYDHTSLTGAKQSTILFPLNRKIDKIKWIYSSCIIEILNRAVNLKNKWRTFETRTDNVEFNQRALKYQIAVWAYKRLRVSQ